MSYYSETMGLLRNNNRKNRFSGRKSEVFAWKRFVTRNCCYARRLGKKPVLVDIVFRPSYTNDPGLNFGLDIFSTCCNKFVIVKMAADVILFFHLFVLTDSEMEVMLSTQQRTAGGIYTAQNTHLENQTSTKQPFFQHIVILYPKPPCVCSYQGSGWSTIPASVNGDWWF